MSLSEKLQDLHVEVSAAIERAVSALRQDLSERLRSSNEDLVRRLEEFTPEVPASLFDHEGFAHVERGAGAQGRRHALTELRDDLAAIDRERSQADILRALLGTACHHASRAAIFLTRADGIKGWGSEGFGDGGSGLQSLSLPASPGSSWEKLAAGHGPVHLSAAEAADLSSRLEVPIPKAALLVPLVLRDRVAAALYADGLEDGPLTLESLQILAYVSAQAMETLPFRERGATSTLGAEASSGGAALGFWPPASEAPAAESAVAPSPEPEAPPVAEEPALEASAPEVAAYEPPPVVEEPSQVSTQQATFESSEPEARTERSYPRPVEAPAAPVEASQNATVLMPRPSFLSGEPIAPAPPASFTPPSPYLEPPPSVRPDLAPATTGAFEEPPPPPPAIPGTAEVKPPTDVDGPGWAFATTRVSVSPGEDAVHDEARRLARLLVSEIKLYNEEQVEEGRRNRDIYERLKEDIDRSRQMYEERVDERIRLTTDYFYQELVRILAAGDSKALGI